MAGYVPAALYLPAKAFNKKLAELRIQRKVGGQWILYAEYLGKCD